MGNVIHADFFRHAMADEARRRYESLRDDDKRLVARLADERRTFVSLNRLEYVRLKKAGIIEERESVWDWTTVGAEVAALVNGGAA